MGGLKERRSHWLEIAQNVSFISSLDVSELLIKFRFTYKCDCQIWLSSIIRTWQFKLRLIQYMPSLDNSGSCSLHNCSSSSFKQSSNRFQSFSTRIGLWFSFSAVAINCSSSDSFRPVIGLPILQSIKVAIVSSCWFILLNVFTLFGYRSNYWITAKKSVKKVF